MTSLRTIIVDDSRTLRAELKILLNDYPEIEIVGEASNIGEAVVLIEEKQPDVIFLDIRLKTENGFDLLERTDVTAKIIFITAYDKYALRAFEVNAIDYLLKPIRKDRLSVAISRLLPDEVQENKTQKRVNYDDVLYLMINRSLKFIKVVSLQCIIAEGKYSYIYYGDGKKDLVSKTLLEWENLLPDKYFVRIHRSTIVNFEYVKKVKKCQNNTHEVYIGDMEKPFIMSRRYAAKLRSVLSW